MDKMDKMDKIDTVNTITELDPETEYHPMSMRLFNTLSAITGFTELNGKTYSEYVEKWRLKHQAFNQQ